MIAKNQASHCYSRRSSLLFILLVLSMLAAFSGRALADPAIPSGDVRIHYFRPDAAYSGWALYTWNASTENASWCSSEVAITGTDSYGVYFDVTVNQTQGTPPGISASSSITALPGRSRTQAPTSIFRPRSSMRRGSSPVTRLSTPLSRLSSKN